MRLTLTLTTTPVYVSVQRTERGWRAWWRITINRKGHHER